MELEENAGDTTECSQIIVGEVGGDNDEFSGKSE